MAEDKIEKLIDIRVNYSDAIEQIANWNQELKRLKDQENALKKSYENNKMSASTYQKNLAALKNEQKQYTEGIRVLNKQIQNQIKEQKAQGTSLNAMRAKLSLLTAKYDNLSREEREAAESGRALAQEIADLSNEIKNAEYQTNRFYRNVGNYPSAFDKMGGRFEAMFGSMKNVGTQLKSMFVGGGIAGGVMSFVAAMKQGVSTAMDFNASVSKLAAILQTTTDDIPELIEQAKELGSTTRYTASEVASLQTELAKLGYSRKDITDMTKSVLLFAQATGAELSDAASLTGSVLRMFGDDASKAQEYVDKMSLATTSSALSFEYLGNAMSTVGPIANSFGFSVDETLALLGQLANAGFDASTAATALRNILLNLADSNGKLAKALGHPVKSAEDLTNGLRTLSARGIDLAETLELTDKRSVAAFNTFLQTADGVDELRKALEKAKGAAEGMAETMEDNLAGALKSLSSAWEGLMIEINSGQGILRDWVQWLAAAIRKLNGFIAQVKQDWNEMYNSSVVLRSAVESVSWVVQSALNSIIVFAKEVFNILNGVGSVLIDIFTFDFGKIGKDVVEEWKKMKKDWEKHAEIQGEISVSFKQNVSNGKIGVDKGIGLGVVAPETQETASNGSNGDGGTNANGGMRNAEKEREKAKIAAEKATKEYEKQLKKELELTLKNMEEEVRIEQEKIELKLAAVKKGTEAEFELRKQALDAQEDAEWVKAQQSIKDEELLEERRLLILDKYGQKRKDLQAEIDAEVWAQQKAEADQMFQEQLHAARKNEVEMARLKVGYALRELQKEQQRGQLETETKAQYNARMLGLQENFESAEEELAQKEMEVQTSKLDVISNTFSGLSSIMEAFGDQSKALAKASKILALGEVAVNTGKAIAAGIAQAQSVPFPANLAAMATTIVSILGNIATAISTIKSAKFSRGGKVEGYATGGKVTGAGSGTSDSITAQLSNGESVMTALTTSLFAPLLSSLNQMGGGVPLGQDGAGTAAMGEDMLARAFAKGAASLPRPVVSVEEINRGQNRVDVLEQLATL